MNYKNIALGLVMMVTMVSSEAKKNIKIILGSTREGRMSDKIGLAIKHMADKRSDVSLEILDLRDYTLPLYYEPNSASQRKEITDPAVKKWSDVIKKADGFILVVPEYNRSYPAVLKNALDMLYKEWNGKPVALVGYSGGNKGGIYAVTHMKDVVEELKMKLVSTKLLIPAAWKAFNARGQLEDVQSEKTVNTMIDELVKGL